MVVRVKCVVGESGVCGCEGGVWLVRVECVVVRVECVVVRVECVVGEGGVWL